MRLLLMLILGLGLGRVAAGQGLVWEKRIGWMYNDALIDVMALDTGSYLALGHSQYFNVVQGYPGDETLTLLKLNGHGDTLWFRPLVMPARFAFFLPSDEPGTSLILCSSAPRIRPQRRCTC